MANDILNEDDEFDNEDNDSDIVIVTDDSDDEDEYNNKCVQKTFKIPRKLLHLLTSLSPIW